MAKIQTLKDKDGEIVYPQTTSEAVYDPESGNTLKDVLAGKQDTIMADNAPIEGSSNVITSGGVYDALNKDLAVDVTMTGSILTVSVNGRGDSIVIDPEAFTPSIPYNVTFNCPVDFTSNTSWIISKDGTTLYSGTQWNQSMQQVLESGTYILALTIMGCTANIEFVVNANMTLGLESYLSEIVLNNPTGLAIGSTKYNGYTAPSNDSFYVVKENTSRTLTFTCGSAYSGPSTSKLATFHSKSVTPSGTSHTVTLSATGIVVNLTTSGTLTVPVTAKFNILVSGGGAGASVNSSGSPGASSGFVAVGNYSVSAGGHAITVGEGGVGATVNTSTIGGHGGASSFGSVVSAAGATSVAEYNTTTAYGGSGGGGAGGRSKLTGGKGAFGGGGGAGGYSSGSAGAGGTHGGAGGTSSAKAEYGGGYVYSNAGSDSPALDSILVTIWGSSTTGKGGASASARVSASSEEYAYYAYAGGGGGGGPGGNGGAGGSASAPTMFTAYGGGGGGGGLFGGTGGAGGGSTSGGGGGLGYGAGGGGIGCRNNCSEYYNAGGGGGGGIFSNALATAGGSQTIRQSDCALSTSYASGGNGAPGIVIVQWTGPA